jgi:hypothetical protein
MKLKVSHRLWTALCCGALLDGVSRAGAADSDPDPKEIPVPWIKGLLGKLQGMNELPVRQEMPDVLTMNDGTRVTTRQQWKHEAVHHHGRVAQREVFHDRRGI